MIRFTTKVLPSRSNHLGIITLNHPKVLHALTLDMIECIQDVLLAWCNTTTSSQQRQQKERNVKAILFKSSTYDRTQQKVRSFCAGGNVKDVYLAGIQPPPPQQDEEQQHGYGHTGIMTSDFFRQEYILNYMLSQLNGSTVQTTLQPAVVITASTTSNSSNNNNNDDDRDAIVKNQKWTLLQQQQQVSKLLPIQISIWDGIVMGGGIGISIYSQYRIMTQYTIFSMPETGIGLFPDVGSLYILPRIIQHYSRHQLYEQHAMCIVTYLLLTGTRLTTYDIYALGFATHYIPSQYLVELEKALIQATGDDDENDETNDKLDDTAAAALTTTDTETAFEGVKDVIGPVLDEYHNRCKEELPLSETSSVLLPHMDDIVQAFTIDTTTSMEDIISKLENNNTSTFAQQTIQTLHKMSPTSLKLTLIGLQRNILSLIDVEKPTFYEELQYEYRIAQHCMKRNDNDMKSSDFYEGIRATLIDKDYTPKWSPSTIQDVSDESIHKNYTNQSIPMEWELPDEYNLLLIRQHNDGNIQENNDSSVTTTIDSKL